MPSTQPAEPRAPSLSQQMNFIIENAGILDRKIKISIMTIVNFEVGEEFIKENLTTKDVDINLDKVGEKNPEAISHIYNLVLSRLKALNNPVGYSEPRKDSAGKS